MHSEQPCRMIFDIKLDHIQAAADDNDQIFPTIVIIINLKKKNFFFPLKKLFNMTCNI